MGATLGTPVGVELRTPDTHHVRSFYGRLLGWDFVARDGGVDCLADGAAVAGVRADGTAPGQWRVLLACDDVAAFAARAERAGATVLQLASDADGAKADVVDPLGATFVVADGRRRDPLTTGTARASWFEIMTSDAPTTDRFYGDVVGYRIEAPDGGAAGGPFALLQCGGRTIGGRLALPTELRDVLGDRWMTYFGVPDVDAATARVAGLGGALLTPPRDAPTGRVAAVSDPAGAIFTLIAPRASG